MADGVNAVIGLNSEKHIFALSKFLFDRNVEKVSVLLTLNKIFNYNDLGKKLTWCVRFMCAVTAS